MCRVMFHVSVYSQCHIRVSYCFIVLCFFVSCHVLFVVDRFVLCLFFCLFMFLVIVKCHVSFPCSSCIVISIFHVLLCVNVLCIPVPVMCIVVSPLVVRFVFLYLFSVRSLFYMLFHVLVIVHAHAHFNVHFVLFMCYCSFSFLCIFNFMLFVVVVLFLCVVCWFSV